MAAASNAIVAGQKTQVMLEGYFASEAKPRRTMILVRLTSFLRRRVLIVYPASQYIRTHRERS